MHSYESRVKNLERVAEKYNTTSVDYADRLAAAKKKAAEQRARLGLPPMQQDSLRMKACIQQRKEDLRRAVA